MIEILKLTKSYGKLQVLNGVSFEIGKGHVTGLIGPNGCGKTTLIKAILGLVFPDSGDIQFHGKSIRNDDLYRQKIGYMPQNPDYPANLKVAEILDLIRDVRGQNAIHREELTNLFDIHSSLDKYFGLLSGGTKQRVAAVAALMFDSPLLILDEPTVGLDPGSSKRFKDYIRTRAAKGDSILLVSHIISEMEQLCDQVVFMLEGSVHFNGSTVELRKLFPEEKDLESVIVQVLDQKNRKLVAGVSL